MPATSNQAAKPPVFRHLLLSLLLMTTTWSVQLNATHHDHSQTVKQIKEKIANASKTKRDQWLGIALDLNKMDLSKHVSAGTLKKALQNLRNKDIQSLLLIDNNLYSFRGNGLKTVLSGLDNTDVTYIGLADNNLALMGGDELKIALTGLDNTKITALNLIGNDLALLRGRGLKTALTGLNNTNIAVLNLSRNNLYSISGKQLKTALKEGLAGTGVEKVSLTNNGGKLIKEKLEKDLTNKHGKQINVIVE